MIYNVSISQLFVILVQSQANLTPASSLYAKLS